MKTLLTALLLALPQSPNLVENGGFEQRLRGWNALANSGRAEFEVVKQGARKGKHCLHITKAGGFPLDLVRADFDVPAGRTVRVSAMLKGEGLGNAFFKFWVYDDAGKSLIEDVDVAHLRRTFGWKEFDKTYELPEGAKRAAVQFVMVMGGDLWIDEVSVTPTGKTKRAQIRKPPKRPPLPAATKTWIDEHAHAMASLDFDADDADLEPLKKILDGKRIVLLGEQSHSDGACFEAKARMIRFLHAELGFSVVAFESGLYECERANDKLRAGDTRGAMQDSVFGIWRVAETRGLFDYMADHAKTAKPLRLSGFDTRGSGAGIDRLFDDVVRATSLELGPATGEALAKLNEGLSKGSYKPSKADRAATLRALTSLRSAFEAKRSGLDEREAGFLSRSLENFAAREAFEFAKNDKGADQWHTTNLRDKQMAENLRWLAEVRYPDAKIVCWGATMHFMHGTDAIRKGGRAFYAGCRQMGTQVREVFGEDCYVVGFVAHSGKTGMPWTAARELRKPSRNSIEDLLWRYGKPLLFVDLSAPGPFDAEHTCGMLGYSPMQAPWSQVVDGLVFTETMHPSSR